MKVFGAFFEKFTAGWVFGCWNGDVAYRNDAQAAPSRPVTNEASSEGLNQAQGGVEIAGNDHGDEAVRGVPCTLPAAATVTGLAGLTRVLPDALPDAPARGRVVVAEWSETGVVVAAYAEGVLTDATHPADEGPFSGRLAGGLPAVSVVEASYRAGLGTGGLLGYLGQTSLAIVDARAAAGDPRAIEVLDALGYQVAKAVGALAMTLPGRPDAIVLRGFDSPRVVEAARARLAWLAPITEEAA